MGRDEILRSIAGHAGRARLKLSAAATAHAEVLAHLNGIYSLIHELQTGRATTTEAASEEPARPRDRHPEWFDGINLSQAGRSYLRSRLEAGDSGGSIAASMGISPSAVTKYRKAWLTDLAKVSA